MQGAQGLSQLAPGVGIERAFEGIVAVDSGQQRQAPATDCHVELSVMRR